MVARMRDDEWDDIPHFSKSEFFQPHKMSRDLIHKLNSAREQANVPFRITSSYRPMDNRSHGLGLAVDVAVTSSRNRLLIVQGAIMAGFTRIGVYDRHVHMDIWNEVDDTKPREVLWLGTSS